MLFSLRRVALCVFVPVALTACTTGPVKKATGPAPESSDQTSSQPAMATYNCADGSMITIQNLGSSVRMRLCTRAIRTIEHNGGIDSYLLGTPDRALTVDAKALKRRLLRARAKREAKAA